MKFILKLLISLTASLIGLTTCYLLVALLLSLIPVNAHKQAVPFEEGVAIYITTNGVHADFTVPVHTSLINWQQHFKLKDFKGADHNFRYIAFGWGDKGFYLNTPSWQDLTLSTAVSALFVPSPTAMHVTYYRHAPAPGENVKEVLLSREQYRLLLQYIQSSFQQTTDGQLMLIAHAGYTSSDNFYEAKGCYSLLYTCNNWVNEGLKKIGVKTSLWTPFDWGILYQLE